MAPVAPVGLGPVTATSADLLPAGALDPTFADGGIALTDISSVVEAADAERQVVGGSDRILVLEASGAHVWRFHPDGTLDTDFATVFGGNGVRQLNLPFTAERLAVGADGSFFVGGYTPSGSGQGVRVAKFNPDGTRDFGFPIQAIPGDAQAPPACPDGPFTQDKLTFTGFADLGVRSDGSVVVAGPGTSETGSPGGELFACFISSQQAVLVVAVSATGVAGSVQGTTVAGSQVRPDSLAVGPGDATLVSVATENTIVNGSGVQRQVGAIRFTTALQADATFGTAGVARISQSPNDRRLPIAVQGGTVAIASEVPRRPQIDGDGSVPPQWDLLRWNSVGTFLGRTSAVFDDAGETAVLGGLAVGTGGSFVAAGHLPFTSAPSALGLAVFTPAGAATVVDHPGPPATGVGVAQLVRLSDGSLRVAGSAYPEVEGLDDHRALMVSRLSAAGAFDATFGPDGSGFAIHHGGNDDQGRGVVVLPDGRIVAAGRIGTFGDAGATGFLLRHEEAGPLDPTFSPTGRPGVEITRYPGDVPMAPPLAVGVAPSDTFASAAHPDGLVPVPAAAEFEAASAHVILVENDSDGDPGSFRAAIEEASASPEPPTVEFTDAHQVQLDGGQVIYTGEHDLTILGAGGSLTAIAEQRILLLAPPDPAAPPALHVEALSVRAGEPCSGASCPPGSGPVEEERGAGISTPGDVTLVDSVFENNRAWDSEGGAVFAGGSISISGSEFLGNEAGHGGAIWAAGPVTVEDSLFTDNHGNLFDSGGAIRSSSNVTVDGSTFIGNSSTIGGAIQADGDVDIVDSTFTDNTATGGGPDDQPGQGGAVRSDASVTVSGSTFTGNLAEEEGGAIWADGAGGVTISGSAFDANQAGFLGGAVHTSGPVNIDDATFEDNGGPHTGGAIFAIGSVTVGSSTFARNSAAFNGGAIYAEPPPGGEISGSIIGSHFDGNTGTSGDGGGVVLHGDLTVDGSDFTDNLAVNGGAIFAWSVTTVDSTFADNQGVLGGALYISSDEGEIIRSTFTGNRADLDGGVVFDGGAIYGGWIVTILESTFVSNAALERGGAVQAVEIVAQDSTFTDNTSGEDGGALHAFEGATIERSTFSGDRAGVLQAETGVPGDGGAAWATTADITDSTFQGNSASGLGGAIRADEVEVSGSTLSANGAFSGGGGIWSAGDVTIMSSTLDGNGSGEGGAVWADGLVTATNSTFHSNGAGLTTGGGFTGADGGAIRSGAGLALTHLTVAANDGASQLFAATGSLEAFGLVVTGPVSDGVNCDVPGTESSYSWDTDGTCGFIGEGDVPNGGDPVLGPLADNGGPTLTMRPELWSPLVDAIPLEACDDAIDVDQRGEPRPFGTGCDIGAVEQARMLDIAVEGLAEDADGRLVIAGSTGGGTTLAIHRLLSDGSPDPAFTNGLPFVLGLAPFSRATFHDVAIDDAGRIVAVGEFSVFDVGPVAVAARLLPDGSPDPSFGEDGLLAILGSDLDSTAYAVAIDASGRIVVTGWTEIDEPSSVIRGLLVARLLDDGALDPTFGAAGLVLDQEGFEGRDVATDGDEVVVVGNGPGWEGPFAFVARFTDVGILDVDFGEPLSDPDALPGEPPGPGFGFPFGLTIDESFEFVDDSQALGVVLDILGNIVVTGQLNGQIALARLLPDGTHDPTFADAAAVITDVGGFAAGEDVAIAPDGKIVVTGHVRDGRGTRVVTARYLPGIGVLECAPATIDFGAPLVGGTLTEVVTCTVTEGSVLVTDVRVEPPNPVDFDTPVDTCLGALLRLGETCTVTTRFSPQVAGAQEGALVVEYAGTQGPGQLAGTDLRGATSAVPAATLTVDPEEGPVETEVEVTGEGYDPGVAVQLLLDDVPVGEVPAADVTAAGFTATFEVPEGTPGGDRTVSGCQRCGTADELLGTATFTVTPRLFLNRDLARGGEVIEATGDGFPANTPVSLRWDQGLGVTTTMAGDDGLIRTAVLLFRRDLSGPRELQARISLAEDVVAEAPFLVVPGSAQPGDFAVRR